MKGKIGFRPKNIHCALFIYGNETDWTVVELLTNVRGLKVEIRMYSDAKAGNVMLLNFHGGHEYISLVFQSSNL